MNTFPFSPFRGFVIGYLAAIWIYAVPRRHIGLALVLSLVLLGL